MVNVTVYAMRFATLRELPRGLSFLGSVRRTPEGVRKKLAMLIFLVSELRGLKVEVS